MKICTDNNNFLPRGAGFFLYEKSFQLNYNSKDQGEHVEVDERRIAKHRIYRNLDYIVNGPVRALNKKR